MKTTLGSRVLYVAMRILAATACALPRRTALCVGDAFARAVWRLYRMTGYRDFVPGNIVAAFPDMKRDEVLRLGERSLALISRSIVEIMRFPLFPEEAGLIVDLRGREHLEAALEQGRGVIVVTAHFGNWELMGAALARWFKPLSVLVQTPSRDAFARLFEEYRRMVGVQTYSNTGPQALRPVLRALRRGELVGLLCDQHSEAREGAATFFGHRVWVPLGPFTLSRRTGAPIVPARIVREVQRQGVGDRHVIEFGAPIAVSDDPDANAAALASRYEQWIREHPDHWLWPHNRFEKAEPAGGGFDAWRRRVAGWQAGDLSRGEAPGGGTSHGGGSRGEAPGGRTWALLACALGLGLAGAGGMGGAPPALALTKPVIVAMPDRLQVLDTADPDTSGAIPLPGRAEAALYVPSREVLVVHMPGAAAISLVDLKPFSPNQYQAFRTFRAPELASYDLGIEEIAGKVLLGYAKTAIAVLDIATWKLEVGFDRPESIPFPFSNSKILYLPGGVFTLKDGQVLFEEIRRDSQGRAATPVSLPFRYQPTAMVAEPAGRHLYVAQGNPAGKGCLTALATETREIRHELLTPGALSSVVWVDDRTLAVLSGSHLGLVDVHAWKLKRWFKMNLPGGTPVRLLPSYTPRAPEPRS